MQSIFLVEDNAADVELFRMALQEACVDCKLTVFDDGLQITEAVNCIQADNNSSVPDLIIVDLNLPKIDGVEVLQRIRYVPRFESVPIVVMSSSSSFRDRDKLVGCNIVDYIVKAADLDEYLKIGETVRNLLEKRSRIS